jgi:hypothetical protein
MTRVNDDLLAGLLFAVSFACYGLAFVVWRFTGGLAAQLLLYALLMGGQVMIIQWTRITYTYARIDR